MWTTREGSKSPPLSHDLPRDHQFSIPSGVLDRGRIVFFGIGVAISFVFRLVLQLSTCLSIPVVVHLIDFGERSFVSVLLWLLRTDAILPCLSLFARLADGMNVVEVLVNAAPVLFEAMAQILPTCQEPLGS